LLLYPSSSLFSPSDVIGGVWVWVDFSGLDGLDGREESLERLEDGFE
jgi:hypothetical protein